MNISGSNFKYYFNLFLKTLDKDVSSASLYQLSSEFQEFLKNKTDVDVDKLSSNFEDLTSDNILELLNSFHEATEDNNDLALASVEDGDNDFMTGFISQLFQDDDFFNSVDTDGNGEIDEEEYKGFFNQVDRDGNSDLSIEELFNGLDEIKNNPDLLTQMKSEDMELGDIASDETNPSDSVKNTNNNGGSYGGGNYAPTTDDSTEVPEETGIGSMTKEQLEEKKAEKQTELDKYNTDLKDVYNGSNEEIAKAKENVEMSKKAYDEAVEKDDKINAELKESKQKNDKNILEKENEISELNISILSLNTQISSLDSTIALEESEIKGLESAKSSLPLSSDNEETKKEAQSKLQEIESKIATLKAQKQQHEAERDKLKAELSEKENSLATKEKDELPKLIEERNKIEKDILENCGEAVKTKLSEYEEARNNLSSTIENEKTTALNNVQTIKNDMAEIESALLTKTQEKAESDNSVSDVFRSQNGMTGGYKTDISAMDYYLMTPNGFDINKDKIDNLLIYLPGSGQSGQGVKSFESGYSSPGYFMKDSNANVCVVTLRLDSKNGRWDCPESAEKIEKFMQEFTSKYKVNKDNISLAGVSLGGSGVVYMANKPSMKKWFKKAVAISPARGNVDTSYDGIPLQMYYGSKDGDNIRSYMGNLLRIGKKGKKTKTNVPAEHTIINSKAEIIKIGDDVDKKQWITHTHAAARAFELDENSNGKSDVFKWLFS